MHNRLTHLSIWTSLDAPPYNYLRLHLQEKIVAYLKAPSSRSSHQRAKQTRICRAPKYVRNVSEICWRDSAPLHCLEGSILFLCLPKPDDSLIHCPQISCNELSSTLFILLKFRVKQVSCSQQAFPVSHGPFTWWFYHLYSRLTGQHNPFLWYWTLGPKAILFPHSHFRWRLRLWVRGQRGWSPERSGRIVSPSYPYTINT